MHPRIYQEIDSNVLEVRYQFYKIIFKKLQKKKNPYKGLLTILNVEEQI